jgi:hypothetical protein
MESNCNAIRNVLRGLRTPLEDKFSALHLQVDVDEATRDVPGSPNIPATILEKIQESDAFVADVSLVNSGAPDDPKKTPNPNVVFELGFAVAHLGWKRVILLFNETYGEVEELPFDFDRHRVSPYRIKDAKDSKSKLKELCDAALSLIITEDPPKPSEEFDPESTKRIRDIRQLSDILHSLHWHTIEEHLEAAPKRVSKEVLFFNDSFEAIRNAATFHLYDTKLLELLDNFGKHFHETLRFGERYDSPRNLNGYIFTYSEDHERRRQEEKDWNYIDGELGELRIAMRELIAYLREEYVELDLSAMSAEAWTRYHYFESRPGFGIN